MKRDPVTYGCAVQIHLCRRNRVLRAAALFLRRVAAFVLAPRCDLSRGKR